MFNGTRFREAHSKRVIRMAKAIFLSRPTDVSLGGVCYSKSVSHGFIHPALEQVAQILTRQAFSHADT
jgi:hypothetical protein